ncbi:MAG: hypothetical protein AB7N71_08255 [Phycisphaerae bacterium]
MPAANHKLFPELAMFPTELAANTAYKDWQKKNAKTWRFWFILIGYSALVGALVAIAFVSIRRWIPLPKSMLGGVVGGVTGGSGIVVLTWLWRQKCRRFLRERLIEQGVPVCIPCGYDLRGLSENRCPECGAEFRPTK